MTPDLQPRVRTFRREPTYSGEARAACIIPTVGGEAHGVEMTITQAKALSLELSRAILEYELLQGPERPALRLGARWRDVTAEEARVEPDTAAR